MQLDRGVELLLRRPHNYNKTKIKLFWRRPSNRDAKTIILFSVLLQLCGCLYTELYSAYSIYRSWAVRSRGSWTL